ncbi:hypothetical protein [Legionella nagasakiensis]|uniref:hypothetical protein n=1 Tax=Legionella nagasakiensis TaxID=535290 RepID=UPI001054A308|nr:hypothetical protein [Legionella nagasakiensis]
MFRPKKKIVEEEFKSVQQEFKMRHKEFFESQLACQLLHHPKLFPSIKKVSDAIYLLITQNKEILLKILTKNKTITEELLDEKYYGRLEFMDSSVSLTEESILQKIQEVLCSDQNNISQILQIHVVFIHRLFDELIKQTDPEDTQGIATKKMTLVNQIFSETLFRDRARKEVNSNPPLTRRLGITRHPVFNKLAGVCEEAHKRAIDRYEIDSSSIFYKNTIGKTIPKVAGPSGHTGALLLGAKLYGDLTAEELHQYAIACFVFLTTGGNHSFHEVMIVANQVGIPYRENDYLHNLPSSITDTEFFKKFSDEFPQYFQEDDTPPSSPKRAL